VSDAAAAALAEAESDASSAPFSLAIIIRTRCESASVNMPANQMQQYRVRRCCPQKKTFFLIFSKFNFKFQIQKKFDSIFFSNKNQKTNNQTTSHQYIGRPSIHPSAVRFHTLLLHR